MAKREERYLNVTLKNEEQNQDEIIVSFSGIFKMLRKLLAIWLVLAVIAAVLIPIGFAVFATEQHKNLTALVSFNYDGIETGLAPDGTQFDINTMKNPAVIEEALAEHNLPLTALEGIRQGISIEGVIPKDAINKITMYKNIYEDGNLSAGEKMLDVTYFPTQYRLTFNYSASGLSGNDAVAVFNSMLNIYKQYFFKNYGFNQALGSSVKALDYTTYDYPESVDVFNDTLSALESYVTAMSKEDTTRFRSTETGYTFSDLASAITTLKTVDLDVISSYVTVNNVTKDRNRLIDYYNYRIETLTRERNVAQDNLATLNDAITTYEKNVTIIYSDGQDPQQYNQASTEYDNLFAQKIEAQNTVSTKTQQINMYQLRVNALKSNSTAAQDKIDRVENDLSALNTKINEMLDLVNATANEYYETVYLGNAYSVLVPASSSALRTTKNIIDSATEPMIIVEALLVVLYLGIAFVMALIKDNKESAENGTGQLEDDTDTSTDNSETETASVEA